MTYLTPIYEPTVFSLVEMSVDVTHASGDTVLFDTLTHTSANTNVTLASNAITLEPGEYYLQGSLGMDRTVDTDTYDATFWDNGTRTELQEADGFFSSISQAYRDTGSLVFQAHVVLTSSLSFYMKSSGAPGTMKEDSSYIFIMRTGA